MKVESRLEKTKVQLSRTDPQTRPVLFEIGTEELPATNLAELFEPRPCEKSPEMVKQGRGESPGENILEVKFKKAFEDQRIGVRSCHVWATPRRLVFLAEGVDATQRPQEEMIKILSKQEAYSSDGQPSEKLLMILKHRNFTLKDTAISEFNGKEFVTVKKSEGVRKTALLLPEIFESLVKSLAFPKNMKWDDSGIYFPRPIRHYLCFYGNQNILFKIGRTRVKNETAVFSKSRRTRHTVKDIPSYFALLKKNGIILDPVERKKMIQEALAKLTTALQGRWFEDLFLLNEVNFLVENPQALSAPFGEEFLRLPLEVLTVSMARKQRIFGLIDKNDKVLPKFIAILDGKVSEKEKKVISSNMEHILHAKLQDSLFFYNEDIKISLEKRREELKNLIFLKNAGSMLEKSDRLVSMAKVIGKQISLSPNDQKNLERACFLGKSDLLTQMVGEFPELQGVMGKYYALENRESSEVAAAISEQYLPRTVQDHLPETLIGSLLSILDKCDLVVACFWLGLQPSSSLDPYGLRRSATSVLKIIIDRKLNFSLFNLLAEMIANARHYGQNLRDIAKNTQDDLDAFFNERFKSLLVDKGFREDLVTAVMVSKPLYLYEAYQRVGELSKLTKESSFSEAWKVVERTSNILKSNKEMLPDKPELALFQEDLERQVFESYEKSHRAIQQAAESRNFKLATSLYAEAFFDILNQFFEKVFVNAEDLTIRKNRLALLRAVNRLYTVNIADLSKIRLALGAESK